MKNKHKYLLAIGMCLIFTLGFSYFQKTKTSFNFKDLIELVPSVVAIIGVFSPGKNKPKRKATKPKDQFNVRLSPSFESGVYGGLIGGAIGGFLNAALFYNSTAGQPLYESLRIVPYCAIMGSLVGGIIQLNISLFQTISSLSSNWSYFLGSFLGCIIAGIFSGVIGMWLFGSNNTPFIGYHAIVVGSIATALFIILGALIFDYEGKIRYVLFSLIIAFVLASIFVVIGFLIFDLSHIGSIIESKTYSIDIVDHLTAGAMIGLINGGIFGLIIGFTILFYKYWRFAEKQEIILANLKDTTNLTFS